MKGFKTYKQAELSSRQQLLLPLYSYAGVGPTQFLVWWFLANEFKVSVVFYNCSNPKILEKYYQLVSLAYDQTTSTLTV